MGAREGSKTVPTSMASNKLKQNRIPGDWPHNKAYRPQISTPLTMKKMVHHPLDFLSFTGAEARLMTANTVRAPRAAPADGKT